MPAALPAAHDAACDLQGSDPLPTLQAGWRAALATAPSHAVLVAESGAALLAAWRRSTGASPATTLTPLAADLLEKPFSIARIEARLVQQLEPETHPGAQTVLVVDMDWLLQAPSAMANGAIWGTIIERLFGAGVHGCLSLYHRRHLPERDLLAGQHAHAAVLAPNGCHVNPYQLPTALAASAGSTQTARLRLDHWLGHLSPALRAQVAHHAAGELERAAPLSGGEPPPVLRNQSEQSLDDDSSNPASTERCKIRCFGSLRADRRDGQALAWHSGARPGKTGATRKLRGLFAMLLMSGERGVSSAELVDVLWPAAAAPEHALNRLHHTGNALRQLLLPPETPALATAGGQHAYLVRQDQRYILRPPPNEVVNPHGRVDQNHTPSCAGVCAARPV